MMVIPDDFWEEHLNMWQRPEWAKIIGYNGINPWYDHQFLFDNDHNNYQFDNKRIMSPEPLDYPRLDSDEKEIIQGLSHTLLPRWQAILVLSSFYDLTVLYGPLAQYGVLFPKDRPYITLEHGTMKQLDLSQITVPTKTSYHLIFMPIITS